MKTKNNVIYTILFTFFLTISFVFLASFTHIYAQTECPSNIDPNSQACVDYLRDQLSKLQGQQSSLEKKLKAEEYQQLSLAGKISYMRQQISETEKVIKSLEVEIAAHDVEIKLLEKGIEEKEDDISILRQEINVLEQTVSKRVSESYKYSFVGPFEVFMDVKNISTVLRKTKYLAVTRSQDKQSLQDFSFKMDSLEEEELLLAKEKAELQIKRNSIEANKEDLAEERANLKSQKGEQDKLLAESQRRETEYRTEIQMISKEVSEADKAVTDLIMRLYAQGLLGNGVRVTKGQTVGYQGHTGCSFGSHLHFEIRTPSGTRVNPMNGYLSGAGVWSPVNSGTYLTPEAGALMTGNYNSSHQAIDMVSTSQGNQNQERYTVPYGLCYIVDNILNSRKSSGSSTWNQAYLTGEGAPVRAVANGKVYYGVESMWKGKYALVVHDDGNKSFYLHLQ